MVDVTVEEDCVYLPEDIVRTSPGFTVDVGKMYIHKYTLHKHTHAYAHARLIQMLAHTHTHTHTEFRRGSRVGGASTPYPQFCALNFPR